MADAKTQPDENSSLTKRLNALLQKLKKSAGPTKYPEMLAFLKRKTYFDAYVNADLNKTDLQILVDLDTLLRGAPATVMCFVPDITLSGEAIKKFQSGAAKTLFK